VLRGRGSEEKNSQLYIGYKLLSLLLLLLLLSFWNKLITQKQIDTTSFFFPWLHSPA
jgi:hypothetical protein